MKPLIVSITVEPGPDLKFEKKIKKMIQMMGVHKFKAVKELDKINKYQIKDKDMTEGRETFCITTTSILRNCNFCA